MPKKIRGLHRKLRKDKEGRDTPASVVSGIDGDPAVKDAAAFVVTPFDADELPGLVKKTVG